MTQIEIDQNIGKEVYILDLSLQVKSGILTDCAEGGYYGISKESAGVFIFRQPKDIYLTEIEVRAQKVIYRYNIKKKLNQVLEHQWNDIDDPEALTYAINHFPEKFI